MERLTEWLLGLAGTLIIGLSTVLWFMFRDHHSRIRTCERSNISRDDVNALVASVEAKFQRDHHQILDSVTAMKTELRQDINGLRNDILRLYERRTSDRD